MMPFMHDDHDSVVDTNGNRPGKNFHDLFSRCVGCNVNIIRGMIEETVAHIASSKVSHVPVMHDFLYNLFCYDIRSHMKKTSLYTIFLLFILLFAGGCRQDEREMPGKNFQYLNLEGEDFSHQTLINANFSQASLKGAHFVGANLRGASFEGADLQQSDLQGADLRGANFTNCNLKGADLRGANAQEANFDGASLIEVKARGADFSKTKGLSGELQVDLSNDGAIID